MIHIKVFNSSVKRIDSDGYTENHALSKGCDKIIYLKKIDLTITHSLKARFKINHNIL